MSLVTALFRTVRLPFVVALCLPLANNHAWATQAQPVPVPEDPSTAPQVDIAGVGIATARYGRTSQNNNAEGDFNFSDSSLVIGAAQRLYDNGIGSFGFGMLTTEGTQTLSTAALFVHQAFLDYQTESFEALIGRSDNPTSHLVDFPTLREDDLITLTNPLDPFSDGEAVEDNRYSNLASITFNQNLTYFENIHVQHLLNSAGVGTNGGANSFGATFQYLAPPGLEAFHRFPSWGIGFEHILLDAPSASGLHQIYAGGVMNLNESVTDRIDFRAQNLLSFGSDLTSFQNATDSFQANSNALAGSLRYLHSPFGRPGYQLSLTAGMKKYFRVADASSFGLALTGVRRLGQGFDLVAQFQGQWRGPALAQVQSNGLAREMTAELGFIFNFDAILHQHLSPRRSLLNQQHRYIPN